MTDLNEYLEETIDDIGGFGLFQWILVILIFGSKITDNWSTLMMTFGGVVPNWRCDLTTLDGLEINEYNMSEIEFCELTTSNSSVKCNSRLFEPEMSTVVSEWDLVCERSWIPSTITSLQMGGLIAGGFISGQMADTIGRKLTYASALSALLVFNTAAAFSTSWQMLAALRFFIGMGCGFVSSVNFTFVLEFTTRESRSMLRFLPCREVFGILYACLCWWLHDWRYIQIGTATLVVPFLLLIIWFVPESFRWLVIHWKIQKAYEVIKRIAKVNDKKSPEYEKFHAKVIQVEDLVSEDKKYSILDIIDNPRLLKFTLLLMVAWFSCGYGAYGIFFGVGQLAGNIYINLILLNVVGFVQVTGWYFVKCIGRKWTISMFFVIGGCSGVIVGILQTLDINDKETFVTIFALISKACVATGWMSLMLLTAELYPTVVRSIGSGLHNATSGIGTMVAPMVIYASQKIPGLLYMVFAGLMFLSAFFVILLPETNNQALEDTIDVDSKNSVSKKIKSVFNKSERKGYGSLN